MTELKNMNVKAAPQFISRLKLAAALTGMSLSSFVRSTLNERIESLADRYPQLKQRKKAA